MSGTSAAAWQSTRNQFNHEWLQNRYLLALDRLLKILTDEIEGDEAFASQFLATGFAAWERQYPIALEMIDSLTTTMTPRALFERTPLRRWPKDEVWLPEIVDRLWRVRLHIADLVASARGAAQQAQSTYLQLQQCLQIESDIVTVDRLRSQFSRFSQFWDDCVALSQAIEKFPHRSLT